MITWRELEWDLVQARAEDLGHETDVKGDGKLDVLAAIQGGVGVRCDRKSRTAWCRSTC